MKFYQTREFLRLQKEWTRKLKKSEFRDIEPSEGCRLPGEINVKRESARPLRIQSTVEYYTQASKFLWDFQFNNKREREIWFYYSEGYTYREIARIVGDKNHNNVHKFINSLKPVFLSYVKAQWDYDNNDE